MTFKRLTVSVLASALFACLAPAMAQGTNTPRIDRAQQTNSHRIQQGLASGYITPSEAQALYRRDREMTQRERRFKADGRVSPQERQKLRADVASLSADVDRMMRNRTVAPRAGHAGNPAHSGQTPGIDNRKFNISQRIYEGERSGRIDRHEARRLHDRQREIARQEARYKADGRVTPQERRQLQRELAALSDQVERMMRRNPHQGRR